MHDFTEEEGVFEITVPVDNNSAEGKNNVAKTIIKVKRGVHRRYL